MKNLSSKCTMIGCIVFLACIIYSCKKESKNIPDDKGKDKDIVLPVPEFEFTIVNNGTLPVKVTFNNTSKNSTEYSWDFGDGKSATSKNPEHSYAKSGTYSVTLQAENTDGKKSITKSITITNLNYLVKVILITPTDRTFNQKYYDVLKTTALNIQEWYRGHNNGKTFKLQDPIVDTLRGLHSYDWYNNYNGTFSGTDPRFYGYYNTIYEINQVMGANFDKVNFMNAVYVAAPGGGAGGTGFCALGDQDLDGLLGLNPENLNVNRWIGGSAHEWGHAFGLPHPPGEEPEALMWTGYATYPDCILLDADKAILNASPFFK